MRSPATFVAVLALLAASGGPARAEGEWKRWTARGPVTFEKRAVAGSKFLEYRATAVVAAAPAVALEAIWRLLTEVKPATVTRRQVLRKSDSELLCYDQIEAPVVSDREVTLLMTKAANRVQFEARNDLGPKPDGKRVQLPAVRGAWVIEPAGTGARLVFTCFSEPGGSVPPFVVRGPQEDQIAGDVDRVLAAIARRPSR